MELSPRFQATTFQCPHCNVVSQQSWFSATTASQLVNGLLKHTFYDYRSGVRDFKQEAIEQFIAHLVQVNDRQIPQMLPEGLSIATCRSCSGITLWIDHGIVYPRRMPIAPPNDDMTAEIRELYREAATIVMDSPKGAAALLRLALQLLLKQLGKPGKNINSDIRELVASGLSPKIQKALDLLRFVGNNAVHPGQIDLDDDREIALKLFNVLNFITDEMVTKPRELELLYEDVIPDETRKHIDDRDGKGG